MDSSCKCRNVKISILNMWLMQRCYHISITIIVPWSEIVEGLVNASIAESATTWIRTMLWQCTNIILYQPVDCCMWFLLCRRTIDLVLSQHCSNKCFNRVYIVTWYLFRGFGTRFPWSCRRIARIYSSYCISCFDGEPMQTDNYWAVEYVDGIL